MGAVFPDYKFQSPVNTTAKSLYGVKADKKIIVFWSSTCSHCENELPKLLEKYNELKAKNIQVVGFSLDVDRDSYTNKIKAFPWINDSELKGWNSSFADTYNIHATPTYFILDANNKIISKPEHVGDVLDYFKLK
ncbi:TlpA family protein disulfide reductase [Chryseobacterium camelliae]|uniref:Peroxiredoxin n=2 Tax=Chryseobacterium TaxID=59732 RepID=A0ABU0TP19_9FLAO|nr:TlpA disulfide reductase family protein [Chryseobacterium camelliae]MDQ1098777.1 peroxiredoxin [Chryseobacterium camelliae]